MTVLLMGFRLGAVKSLERLKIPYMIWTEKALVNTRICEGVIVHDFSMIKDIFEEFSSQLTKVTHVIALTEASVIPASQMRIWLGLRRNKENVISRCTDKLEMKKFLSKKKIPMTKFSSSHNKTSMEIVNDLGLPLVNKVKLSSGGRGVRFLNTEEEVQECINRSSYFEKLLVGTEGSIESFVKDGEIIFSSVTQYFKNGVCNIIPGNYDNKLINTIKKLNIDVIKSLKLEWGMTHLEYFITDENEIFFGEVALRPPGGYIMDALELAYTQNFWDVFIKVETHQKITSFNSLSNYSSSIIIHPGKGVVSDIIGEDVVMSLESTSKFKLKLKVGDAISSREGVGQDYGHLLLVNKKREKLNQDIELFFTHFKILQN